MIKTDSALFRMILKEDCNMKYNRLESLQISNFYKIEQKFFSFLQHAILFMLACYEIYFITENLIICESSPASILKK